MERLGRYLLLLLNVTGLLALLVIAEVIIYKNNVRLDLTPENKFTISPHAQKILGDHEKPIEVFVFTRDEDPRNPFLRDLFWRVRNEQPLVSYRFIDVNRNPSLARRYNADAYGMVVVESEGRRKTSTNIREEVLIAAILQVTREDKKTIYFLTGHGERDPQNTDRRQGYSTAKAAIEEEFYEVETLSLLGGKDVPSNATAIVIANPRSDLFPEEILKIDAYLERGGALLVLADPGSSPALAAFLARYRVRLADEIVADSEYSLAAGEPLTARIPEVSDGSLVTATLDTDPVFSLARPLEALEPIAGREALFRELLATSKQAWSIPAEGGQIDPADVDFVQGKYERGKRMVGAEVVVALEEDSQPLEDAEEGDEVPRPVSRIIVYGDSDFANNSFLELLGNRDLLLNSVNWLAREDQLIAVRPKRKALGREQFYVSSRQSYWAFLLSTVIQPSIFLGLGAAVYAWRRLR